ncbi:MAG: 3-isopropylmalate dehydrogenase, partial [Bacillota bacterium]|nr:3-isopropylmalate dehydrogenase [Bacillota bacterium]
GLFANLRPVVLWPALSSKTPLKAELVTERPDILVVRELTGGLYFGAHRRVPSKRGGGERATDVMAYTTREIERVARVAFKAAQGRRKMLASADKANVLASSRLWRDTVDAVAPEFPDVEVRHLYADNCAMQMVLRPSQFDVLLAENTFGDILSDLGGALAGSLGMLPSASLGRGRKGLYEPVHGSAPDIAGQGIANPLAAILSAGMMLRHTFGLTRAADAIDRAVGAALDQGYRTRDIGEPGMKITGTSEMGDVLASLVAAEA